MAGMLVRKSVLGVMAVCGVAAMAAFVAEPPKDGATKGEAEGGHAAPQAKSAAMDALKTLAGTWEADTDKDGKPDGTTVYRVSSGGAVVVETMLPGTEHEMTNTYHMDGQHLLMTHYCAMGNQPRLKCKDPQNGKAIAFEFKDGTNMDPKTDGYMGALTLTIIDSDHIRQEWRSFKAGKPQGEPAVFELVRKK